MERAGWWGPQGQLLEAKDRSKQGQARVDWGPGIYPTALDASHRCPWGSSTCAQRPRPGFSPSARPRRCCPPSTLTGQLLLHTLCPRCGGNPGEVPCRIGWGTEAVRGDAAGRGLPPPHPIWSPGKEVCVSKEV